MIFTRKDRIYKKTKVFLFLGVVSIFILIFYSQDILSFSQKIVMHKNVSQKSLPLSYDGNLFNVSYPVDFVLQTDAVVDILKSGEVGNAVKVYVSPRFVKGTNLSSDSYLSVESSPQVTSCHASDLLPNPYTESHDVLDDGVKYSVATSSDAAAGNRYEESVYLFQGRKTCTWVRYFIHYGVFQNYEEGAVKEFDKALLYKTFDDIRHSIFLK